MDILLFPQTLPDPLLIHTLSPFFDGLTCLRPLEDEDCAAPVPFSDITSLCRKLVPAPLGADRPRFLRMLRDLRSHPDEYYEGFLRSLSETLAGQRPELVEDLIAGFSPHRETRAAEGEEQEALWQARLVLALAETVEAEEAAAAAGLAAVAAREKALLASLHGETDTLDEEEIAFTREVASSPTAVTASAEKTASRCLAWARLFLAMERTPACPVLAVSQPDALAWLGNQYEKKTRNALLELGSLPLPGGMEQAGEAGRRLTMLDRIRKDAEHSRLRLHQLLQETAAGGETAAAGAALTNLAGEWAKILTAGGEQAGSGGSLRFLLFPDLSIRELLASALRRPLPATDYASRSQGLVIFREEP